MQSGHQHVLTSSETYRTIPTFTRHVPRGSSRCGKKGTSCWSTDSPMPKGETLDIWRVRARWSTHLGNLVVHAEGGVTEQRGVRILQHGTLCKWGHRIGQHDARAGTRSSSANLDRCCSDTRTASPKRERRNQMHFHRKFFLT